MSIESCLDWLVDVKPSSDRVGPLTVLGLINDSMPPPKFKVPSTLLYQVCSCFSQLLCMCVVTLNIERNSSIYSTNIIARL